jgi:prepilin-type N-terminal cleavage/methylation domain-containing protein
VSAAGRARSRATTRGPRRGMTLVEVIVAIVILVGATLTMGGFVSRFAHTTSVAELRASAAEIAAERLETVKQAPAYARLEASYEGVDSALAGRPGYRRATLVERVTRADAATGGVDDYTLVTVVVTHAALSAPVRKTTVISAF